jgi:hypothetical protein
MMIRIEMPPMVDHEADLAERMIGKFIVKTAGVHARICDCRSVMALRDLLHRHTTAVPNGA